MSLLKHLAMFLMCLQFCDVLAQPSESSVRRRATSSSSSSGALSPPSGARSRKKATAAFTAAYQAGEHDRSFGQALPLAGAAQDEAANFTGLTYSIITAANASLLVAPGALSKRQWRTTGALAGSRVFEVVVSLARHLPHYMLRYVFPPPPDEPMSEAMLESLEVALAMISDNIISRMQTREGRRDTEFVFSQAGPAAHGVLIGRVASLRGRTERQYLDWNARFDFQHWVPVRLIESILGQLIDDPASVYFYESPFQVFIYQVAGCLAPCLARSGPYMVPDDRRWRSRWEGMMDRAMYLGTMVLSHVPWQGVPPQIEGLIRHDELRR
ncbi:MAG: hypothetical protein M1832_000289 [Thelocarpon impressellum]|nr:MAG: hypothetical protein M1832_000289 [Thelocarpon impressellum]